MGTVYHGKALDESLPSWITTPIGVAIYVTWGLLLGYIVAEWFS